MVLPYQDRVPLPDEGRRRVYRTEWPVYLAERLERWPEPPIRRMPRPERLQPAYFSAVRERVHAIGRDMGVVRVDERNDVVSHVLERILALAECPLDPVAWSYRPAHDAYVDMIRARDRHRELDEKYARGQAPPHPDAINPCWWPVLGARLMHVPRDDGMRPTGITDYPTNPISSIRNSQSRGRVVRLMDRGQTDAQFLEKRKDEERHHHE
jgi:hypothetical protein